MFWHKYSQLCTKIGKSANAVAEELGISSGTVSGWKNDGRVPYNSTKLKITKYFGVDSDYFDDKEDIKKEPDFTYALYNETKLTQEQKDSIKLLYENCIKANGYVD